MQLLSSWSNVVLRRLRLSTHAKQNKIKKSPRRQSLAVPFDCCRHDSGQQQVENTPYASGRVVLGCFEAVPILSSTAICLSAHHATMRSIGVHDIACTLMQNRSIACCRLPNVQSKFLVSSLNATPEACCVCLALVFTRFLGQQFTCRSGRSGRLAWCVLKRLPFRVSLCLCLDG